MTLAEFHAAIARARPGERVIYHSGYLPIDRSERYSRLREDQRKEANAVAEAALSACEAGRLHLLQEKLGPHDFDYLAVKRERH